MSREVPVWISSLVIIMRINLIIFSRIHFGVIKRPSDPWWRVLKPTTPLLYRAIIRHIMLPQFFAALQIEGVDRRRPLNMVHFFPCTSLGVSILLNHIALLRVYHVTHHILVLRMKLFVFFLWTRLHIGELMTVFLR